MKRLLVLLGISIAGAAVVCGGIWGYQALYAEFHPPEAEAALPQPSHRLEPLPDVDAMAKRIPFDQEVYTQVRDEALATYAKLHPGSHPYDDEARDTLKLASYLLTWDDFYGENLWNAYDSHTDHLSKLCPDQVWLSLHDISWIRNWHSSSVDGVKQLNACEDRLAATDYPAVFKLYAYQVAFTNILMTTWDKNFHGQPSVAVAMLPALADKTAACYRQLIAQHVAHEFLYRVGVNLMNSAKDDEPALKELSKGFDQAFSAEDRDNPEADILDGEFYIDDAWNARGGGWANTVTPQGWQLFTDRLERANNILTDVYGRTPQEPGLAKSMMTVVLGQQQPLDQMELWFSRGQNVPGNLFSLYVAKEYYLLPRWYGSDEEVWKFGLECAKSTNWAAKIPIELADGICDRAERDSTVYAQPEIWAPLEKVYRDYLDHYPRSTHYRSMFALAAAQGGHWDVAREQFKILGDNWDADVFPDKLYTDTMSAVNAH